MSDKCQHCTEMQVRIDLNMYIAWLEAELDNARATIERLNRRAQAAEGKLAELTDHGAKNVKLNQRIAELEAELESNAWKISPAMAQAQIDQLNAELAAMRDRAAKAMHDYETAMQKLAKVEAERTKLQAAHEQCLIERNRLGVEKAGLQAQVERLKAENQWHPASVRPDHCNNVLAINNNGDMWIDFWYAHGNCWFYRYRPNHGNMTMWRELPKPPQEAGK